MKRHREASDVIGETKVGSTIQLWRSPNRIWPAFPTLVVLRAASRLTGRSPAVGNGGVVSVFLDGSKVGAISPKQIEVYQVSPGENSLSVHFLGGLRRSRKFHFSLAESEEKQFVCLLNAFGWPSIRPATPNDGVELVRGDPNLRGSLKESGLVAELEDDHLHED